MLLKNWLLVLLLITVAVRLPIMFGVNRTGWDERAYAVFAQTLDERGISGIRQWMHDYKTNESLQKSPLFLRVGFIVPAMVACKILGGFTPDNVAWLSFVSGVALVVLGAHFAEKLAGHKLAMLCGILLIASPLAAGLSRRGTQDVFTALVFVACLYFFHKSWSPRGLLAPIALGACLCLALLTKESALLLYPMMAVAAAYYYRAMALRLSRWAFVALVAAPLIYLLIEIAICGDVTGFVDTYRTYASLQQTLDYTVHYEKGPWFHYLLDLLAIAPIAFVGAVAGLSVPLTDEPARHGRNLALIYLAGGILLFGQLPILNVRLVLFLDSFLRLGSAIGVAYVAGRFDLKWARRITLLALGLILISDSFQFYQIFVSGNVYSPTTFLILRAEGFYDSPR
jgi:4-amino-4-deoxy-L-arabinose transferase-like glycosyltransferase